MFSKPKQDDENIFFRLHLYFPLTAVIFLMVLITIVSVVYVQENAIHTTKEKNSNHFSLYFGKKIQKEADVLSESISFVQEKRSIAERFETMDKRALYRETEAIYNRLHQKIELTHMYFIRPDGTVLLRMHDYAKDGDTITRATFLKSKESNDEVHGLEFGIKKNFTLRVIRPWYVNGKLIGYLELGKEVDKLIEEYASLLDTQVYLAVKKEVYKDAPETMKKALEKKGKADGYYIAYGTAKTPDEMEAILQGTHDASDITMGDHDYYVSTSKLSDFSQKDLGYFVFLQDVTLEHRVMYSAVKALSAMLFIAATVFFVTGYVLIRRKENAINGLTAQLNHQNDELQQFNVRLQKLFDLQKNIVILTDGIRLIMANQAMYHFLGFRGLEDFLHFYNCICDRFIENDNFFHLGKVPKGENWVEAIRNLPPQKRIVAILSHKGRTHIFSVAVNEFEAGKYVIAFTDISNTMMEQVRLMQKATHDKLTGAYNREFLDNNLEQIIHESEDHQLGVILCDIDYFKRVNDTYGHQRGDEVLKKFVSILQQSIRGGDYLIRWGGEEFIVLMKVDSRESLEKAMEHLRSDVERTPFEEVGQITASFGATLYGKGESIHKSIARADKALYEAKANGRNQVHIE